MKKEKFSIVNSALAAYADELNPELIQEKFFATKSLDSFNKMLVKAIGTTALNVLDIDQCWQDTSCGIAESGSTTFTQRDLTTNPISVRHDWCKSAFYTYWQSYFMNNTMAADGGTIESQIVDAILEKTSDQMEVAVWQAEDGGSDTCYKSFNDGLIQVLSGASCVDLPTTASSLTYANIDASVQAMTDAIPDAIAMENDLVLYLSPANFRVLARKYNDTYNGFQERKFDNDYTMMSPEIPNLKISGVRGLNGLDYMVITPASNVVIPYTSDFNLVSTEYTYDNDSRKHIIFVDFIMGVQVGRPEYVITNFLTA